MPALGLGMFKAGWPSAFSALLVAKDVFEERSH
jgi:alkylhydroperoxidase/carboxymuconolactone decarboxylase family protein YurZ